MSFSFDDDFKIKYEKEFQEALSYSRVYTIDKDFDIADAETNTKIKFANTESSLTEKRKIAYNIALYNICSSIRFISDEKMQIEYNQSIFESAYPIVKDFENLAKSKIYSGSKLHITDKDLNELTNKHRFKYNINIVESIMNPYNLKAICEHVFDRDINKNQDYFETDSLFKDGIKIDIGDNSTRNEKSK